MPDVSDERSSFQLERRQALKIAATYAVIGSLWILMTSGALVTIFVKSVVFSDLPWGQMLSGMLMVFASSWMLYLLVKEKLQDASHAAFQLRLRDRAFEASVNSIIITANDPDENRIVYVNPAFERITGYSRNEVLGRDCRFLLRDDNDQPALENIRIALRDGKSGHALLRNYRKDGRLFWNDLHIAPVCDDDGKITHYVGIQNDVSDTIRYQQELEYQATHDILTGLPNRSLLNDRIDRAISHGRRYNHLFAVAMINLDNFKLVNDTLGYPAGDQLLQMVTERLAACVRQSDTVARLGGDEFVLVLFEQPEESPIKQTLARVLDEVAKPYQIGGHKFHLSCSIGFVMLPAGGDVKAADMLKHADIAMYHAKALGRNNIQYFSEDMDARFAERISLDADLRSALDNNQLFLNFQPQISLSERRVIGVEALLRWRHPDRGMVSPAHFIPFAEETDLIVPIGEWVLQTACRQAKAWLDEGMPSVKMSINISTRQFMQKNLARVIARTLAETGLPPSMLELEITESLIMHNAELFITTLQELKGLGVDLAVDDFGTGYSSLSYLKRFPIDRLKIDQSFIRDIEIDTDSAAISQAVISLGHSMGLRVIAEGVETAWQHDFLHANRCDEIQGYYFSRPLSADELVKFISSNLELP